MPTVNVCVDYGPPDANPAAGSVYIFFSADDVSEAELKQSINALALALRSDFALLKIDTEAFGSPSVLQENILGRIIRGRERRLQLRR